MTTDEPRQETTWKYSKIGNAKINQVPLSLSLSLSLSLFLFLAEGLSILFDFSNNRQKRWRARLFLNRFGSAPSPPQTPPFFLWDRFGSASFPSGGRFGSAHRVLFQWGEGGGRKGGSPLDFFFIAHRVTEFYRVLRCFDRPRRTMMPFVPSFTGFSIVWTESRVDCFFNRSLRNSSVAIVIVLSFR